MGFKSKVLLCHITKRNNYSCSNHFGSTQRSIRRYTRGLTRRGTAKVLGDDPPQQQAAVVVDDVQPEEDYDEEHGDDRGYLEEDRMSEYSSSDFGADDTVVGNRKAGWGAGMGIGGVQPSEPSVLDQLGPQPAWYANISLLVVLVKRRLSKTARASSRTGPDGAAVATFQEFMDACIR